MLEHTMQVWCTDSGQHSRTELGAVLVSDVEVRPKTTRSAAPPWQGRSGSAVRGKFDDEIVESIAPARMIKNAPIIRDDHGGRARWRFTCPRCGRDVPMRGERLDRLIRDLLAIDQPGFDVSMLPR